MSSMLTPARPSARAISATVPGRFSTATRSSISGESGSSASSIVRRSSRAASCQRESASRSPLRTSSEASWSRATTASISAPTASEFELKMSAQIAGFAPATLVASRKLRPTSAGRSEPPPTDRAAAETSTLARTCGRWLIAAISRSWISASMACGRAPMPGQDAVEAVEEDALRARRRRQVPAGAVEEVLAGARDPGGLGPGERMPADEAIGTPARPASASTSVRFVEPTSLTTASGPDASSASTTSAGQRGDRRRAEDHVGVRRRGRGRRRDAIERAHLERAIDVRRVGVVADDLGAEPAPGGQPDRAPDQPDAEHGDPGRRGLLWCGSSPRGDLRLNHRGGHRGGRTAPSAAISATLRSRSA